MRQETLRAALAGLFVVGLAAQLNAASLEEIEKQIVAAAEKIQSYTADTTMVMDMDQPGMSVKSIGKGIMEYMRKGDKALMRIENESSTTTKLGEQEQKLERKELTVMDGEFAYTLTDDGTRKSATKMKLDPTHRQVASKEMFEVLKKDADVKALDDEKIDGTDCYVLEITPKQKVAAGGKTKQWYAKETGILIKTITMTPDGKPMHTMIVSNIKMNPKIDAERFTFKAPEGVEVVDISAMDQPRPAGRPQTTDQPKEEEEDKE